MNTAPPELRFREKAGLLGIPREHLIGFIDDYLATAEEESPEERRELVMDHRLLATLVDFFARLDLRVRDERGFFFVPLKRGGRAYTVDDYADFLEREPKFFAKLTAAVKEALWERFVVDANEAAT